jgi:hypothetical protein
MDYHEAKNMVNEKGWDSFTQYFEKEYKGNFYSTSTAWYEDSKYILKLKGGSRDLVIGWEGIHNKE